MAVLSGLEPKAVFEYFEKLCAVPHGSGNTTLYGHMSSRKVSVGQQVKQGDVLGITGSTGRSTGPHLHFEIKENDTIINPLNDGAAPKKGYLTGYTLSD